MYNPKTSQILDRAPKFNTFYRPLKSRNVYLSQVARVAAKNAGLPDNMTFPTIKAIAASPWNKGHIAYTSKGYENYGIQGPAFNKKYSAAPLATVGTGDNYPVLWIPDPRNPKTPEQFFKVPIKEPTKPVEPVKPFVPVEPVKPIEPKEPTKPIIILEPIDEGGGDLIDDLIIDDPDLDPLGPGDEIDAPIIGPGGKTIIYKGPTKEQIAAYKKKLKGGLNKYINRRIDQRIELKFKQLQQYPEKGKGKGKRPKRGDDMSWAAVPLFSLVALL